MPLKTPSYASHSSYTSYRPKAKREAHGRTRISPEAIGRAAKEILLKGYIDPARNGAPEADKPAAVQQAGAVK